MSQHASEAVVLVLLLCMAVVNSEVEETGEVSIEPVDCKLIYKVALIFKAVNRMLAFDIECPSSLLINILLIKKQVVSVLLALEMHAQHAFSEFTVASLIFLQVNSVLKLIECLVGVFVALRFYFVALDEGLTLPKIVRTYVLEGAVLGQVGHCEKIRAIIELDR